MLEAIHIKSKQPTKAAVVWLHGLGADGHDFVPMVEALQLPADKPMDFIFPHAPFRDVTINNGMSMRAWFDITDMNFEGGSDAKGIAESVVAVEAVIGDLIRQGFDPAQITLGGFSQGGVIALLTGLIGQYALRQVIALSCFLPREPSFSPQHQPPIFWGHGKQDDMVPLAWAQQGVARLREMGLEVAFESYFVGHGLCEPEVAAIRELLMT